LRWKCRYPAAFALRGVRAALRARLAPTWASPVPSEPRWNPLGSVWTCPDGHLVRLGRTSPTGAICFDETRWL